MRKLLQHKPDMNARAKGELLHGENRHWRGTSSHAPGRCVALVHLHLCRVGVECFPRANSPPAHSRAPDSVKGTQGRGESGTSSPQQRRNPGGFLAGDHLPRPCGDEHAEGRHGNSQHSLDSPWEGGVGEWCCGVSCLGDPLSIQC